MRAQPVLVTAVLVLMTGCTTVFVTAKLKSISARVEVVATTDTSYSFEHSEIQFAMDQIVRVDKEVKSRQTITTPAEFVRYVRLVIERKDSEGRYAWVKIQPKPGAPKETPAEQRFEAFFENGSWQDFDAGRELTLAFSDTGMQALKLLLTDSFKQMAIPQIAAQVEKTDPKYTVKDALVSVEVIGKCRITGNKSRLAIAAPDVILELEAPVEKK